MYFAHKVGRVRILCTYSGFEGMTHSLCCARPNACHEFCECVSHARYTYDRRSQGVYVRRTSTLYVLLLRSLTFSIRATVLLIAAFHCMMIVSYLGRYYYSSIPFIDNLSSQVQFVLSCIDEGRF